MDNNIQFETLCLKGKSGYCYEDKLLVQIDKVENFDEAVIRLITKCGSILTQLKSLGNYVSQFSVGAIGTVTYMGTNSNVSIHGERGGSTALSRLWTTLQQQSYTGVVAISRIKINSMPKNGSRSKYKLIDLVEMLLNHIYGNFMFQKYSPEFVKPIDTELQEEEDYILYFVYKIDPNKVPIKSRSSLDNNNLVETKQQSTEWSSSLTKKQRHDSGGDTISNYSFDSEGFSSLLPLASDFPPTSYLDDLKTSSLSTQRSNEINALVRSSIRAVTSGKAQQTKNITDSDNLVTVESASEPSPLKHLRSSANDFNTVSKEATSGSTSQPLSGRVLRRTFPKS